MTELAFNPCIVIPVSLVGAFFVMYVAGFSITVLSMLAIVLGLVEFGGVAQPEREQAQHEENAQREDGAAPLFHFATAG